MYPPPPNRARSSVTNLDGRQTRILRNRETGVEFVIDNFDTNFRFVDLYEERFSENHPGWRNLRGSSDDKGGPFFLFRQGTILPNQGVSRERKFTLPWPWEEINTLSGSLLPCPPTSLEFPPAANASEGQMNRWGAEAVAKAAPGTSPTNLVVMLGELKKDGLPEMIGSTFKRRTGVAKAAGDEYLNAQFGWAPLLRDVKSLAHTVVNADDILAQLERDAGRKVRRRVTLEDSSELIGVEFLEDNSSSYLGPLTSTLINEFWPPSDLVRYVTLDRKVWFSGSFTYYLPSDYYARDRITRAAARAKLLTGLEPKPSTLWQLAPWSWAADWFSNAGECISNAERFLTEGLVMHHGYLMEHTVHKYTYARRNTTASSPPPVVLFTETKSRVQANPFGFGIDFPSLNGFQWSILGALGLSKRG